MAKFNFKMENILKLKRQLEEQEKIAFGLAASKTREEEAKLQELIIRRAGYERQARELVKGKLDYKEIAENKNAIAVMKSLVRTQMIAVSKAQKEEEVQRMRLNQAITERKTYEKLKEKAFDEFKREIAYEENKAIDELVSFTHN